MGIAGVWECWKGPIGIVESYAMLTVNADAHELMRLFHAPGDEKRMVVILDEDDFAPWISAGAAGAARFLRPFPAEQLVARAEPKPPRSMPIPLAHF